MKLRRSPSVVAMSLIACVLAFANLSLAQEKHDHGHDHDHDHDNSLVTAAKKDGQLNTFIAAANAAGIEEDLHHGEFTIFAPTDEAFAKLGGDKLDDLLKPENKERLKSLLMAHVVKGKLASAAVKTEPTVVKSEAGTDLSIRKEANGDVKVNDAKVVKADLKADNGFIHAIDTVIEPVVAPAEGK